MSTCIFSIKGENGKIVVDAGNNDILILIQA